MNKGTELINNAISGIELPEINIGLENESFIKFSLSLIISGLIIILLTYYFFKK